MLVSILKATFPPKNECIPESYDAGHCQGLGPCHVKDPLGWTGCIDKGQWCPLSKQGVVLSSGHRDLNRHSWISPLGGLQVITHC